MILISNHKDRLHLTFIKTVFFFVLLLKIDCGYTSEPPHFYVLSKNKKNEILQPFKVTAYIAWTCLHNDKEPVCVKIERFCLLEDTL